ncbi:MAG: PQQ-binding-like beta-propeller repeat protein, partial [Anaerolineae bacterium]|nr:PQQ-binding-like beta-propeller repeat protein [Anaerolineae bacterium]
MQQRFKWQVWLLVLVFALAAGTTSAVAASSTHPIDHPRSLIGQVVDVSAGQVLLRTLDGASLSVKLSPRMTIWTPAGREGVRLSVGQKVRVRVLPQPDGTLVTANIRVLRQASQLTAAPKGIAPERMRAEPQEVASGGYCGNGGNQPTGDWPTLGGGNDRSFYSTSEQRLAPPLSPVWQLYNDEYWVTASPAITNGVAYVGGYDGFYALDLANQTTLWAQKALDADNEFSSPAVANGMVYFGTWKGDVYALNTTTGNVKWQHNVAPEDTSPQVYSPVVANGAVYVTVEAYRPSEDDPSYTPHVLSVYALDATDGHELWHTDVASVDGNSAISDPTLVDGVIYVGTRDQGTFALDTSDGHILWHAPHPDGAVRANVNFDGYVLVHDGRVVIPFTFGTYPDQWDVFYAYDAATGNQVWTYQPTAPAYRFNSSALAYNGAIYEWLIAPGDTTKKDLVAIDASDGTQLWRRHYEDNGDDGGWWWQSAANGVLYRTSASLLLKAFDMADGAELDSVNTGTSIEVPAAIGAGRLVVPDEEGTLWVFGGETGALGICGTVFSDNNLNGVRDTGEPGIANVTLTLTGVVTSTDGLTNTVVMTVTTDNRGEYGFLNLTPGTYTVQETDPPGFRSVAAHPGSTGGTALDANTIADIPLPADVSSVDNDFGDVQPVDILGTVFEDMNLNGVYDNGEPPLTGVTVTLTGGTEPLTAVTDDTGAFAFLQVLPGSYVLHEENPAGYFSTTTDDLPVTAIYPGQVYEGNNFGDARYVQVGGTVFE